MSRSVPTEKKPTLADVLDTTNAQEQIERAHFLRMRAQNMPVTIVMTFDPLTQKTSIVPVGVDVNFDVVHAVQQAAIQEVRRQEMEALKQQSGGETATA